MVRKVPGVAEKMTIKAFVEQQSTGEVRFEFKNKTANRAEIYMYGPIGEDWYGGGITGKWFADELKNLGAVRNIELHVDSPGGNVTDARTIYTLLTNHKAKIEVKIDGFAASAASFIAMAGDSIAIAEGGFFMIHKARGVAAGDDDDMLKAAELLKSLTETIAQTYVARTGISKSKILDWMAEETWFTGAQAVEHGFANELMENKRVTACAFNVDFKNMPAALDPRVVRAQIVKNRVKRMLENAS